ncbi:hypothetical protein Ccrd_019947 [Cynara cardunculus var. scolymus]|uniref:Uncharacterized protein n=1 Tax=Cynara cardunculus var. scolymus TaxID=59895 RepID=A0A103Y3C7_CYNCS|nr:hypothetical protein Ccrd_019947 [Cynara cardunculus var. scolymus]
MASSMPYIHTKGVNVAARLRLNAKEILCFRYNLLEGIWVEIGNCPGRRRIKGGDIQGHRRRWDTGMAAADIEAEEIEAADLLIPIAVLDWSPRRAGELPETIEIQQREHEIKRRSRSISPRRHRKSRSPTPRRRKSRSPTPRRHRRQKSRSTSLSPIANSPSIESIERKVVSEKTKIEEEQQKKRFQIEFWPSFLDETNSVKGYKLKDMRPFQFKLPLHIYFGGIDCWPVIHPLFDSRGLPTLAIEVYNSTISSEVVNVAIEVGEERELKAISMRQHEAELKLLEEETAKRVEEAIRKRVQERLNSDDIKLEIQKRLEEGRKKEQARKEKEELQRLVEENRRRMEEAQRREAMEQQRREEERYRELEELQRQKEEALRRKKQQEEEERSKQQKLLGKNKSRPKLSFAIGSK